MAYNGADFCGWQIQPGVPTVQETLEKALSTVLRQSVAVVGAGRTDTGVHASFYVAHFDVEGAILDGRHLAHQLNSLLGKSIAVRCIYAVADDAHARFSALSRTYKYFIDKQKDPFTCDYAWRAYPLPDVGKMNEACRILMEYRDFTSFSKLHTDVKTNECTLYAAWWEDTGGQLVFTIKANRFLRNMVRAIVGTLVEIGQGKMLPEEIRRIIEAKNRCDAGTSVPGKGLFLCDIEYPDEIQKRRNE